MGRKRDLPTWSFGEDNVIFVLGFALDEMDTSVVLPVTHGLTEESLVFAAEVAVNLVGIIPSSQMRSVRAVAALTERLFTLLRSTLSK